MKGNSPGLYSFRTKAVGAGERAAHQIRWRPESDPQTPHKGERRELIPKRHGLTFTHVNWHACAHAYTCHTHACPLIHLNVFLKVKLIYSREATAEK